MTFPRHHHHHQEQQQLSDDSRYDCDYHHAASASEATTAAAPLQPPPSEKGEEKEVTAAVRVDASPDPSGNSTTVKRGECPAAPAPSRARRRPCCTGAGTAEAATIAGSEIQSSSAKAAGRSDYRSRRRQRLHPRFFPLRRAMVLLAFLLVMAVVAVAVFAEETTSAPSLPSDAPSSAAFPSDAPTSSDSPLSDAPTASYSEAPITLSDAPTASSISDAPTAMSMPPSDSPTTTSSDAPTTSSSDAPTPLSSPSYPPSDAPSTAPSPNVSEGVGLSADATAEKEVFGMLQNQQEQQQQQEENDSTPQAQSGPPSTSTAATPQPVAAPQPTPPVAATTPQPTPPPTPRPTKRPTKQPTKQPTLPPTKQPTRRPTPMPTPIPTKGPTRAPSDVPSDAPSLHPTIRPTTAAPTKKPTEQPTTTMPTTKAPTSQPSESPSDVPTGPPSIAPSRQPSESPTHNPTTFTPEPTVSPQPTGKPSAAPSAEPSVAPSDRPSEQPSAAPSMMPSSEPSNPPSLPLQEHIVTVGMTLFGFTGLLQPRSRLSYERVTAVHIADSIGRDPDVSIDYLFVDTDIAGQKLMALQPNQKAESQQFINGTNSTATTPEATFRGVGSFSANSTANATLPPTTPASPPDSGEVEEADEGEHQDRRRSLLTLRRLQQQGGDLRPLQIDLVVQVDYRGEGDYNASMWVAEAFNSPEKRDAYIERLKSTNDAAFDHLTSVEVADVDGTAPIEEEPKAKQNLIGVYVGSVFGGLVAVGLVFAAVLLKTRRDEKARKADEVVPQSLSATSGSDPKVTIQTEICVDKQDDISTLGDPVYGGHAGGMTLLEPMNRDERTASIGDADYDYKSMYHNTGAEKNKNNNTSTLEDRDRRFSSDSQPISVSRVSSSQSGYSTKMGINGPMTASVFSDDVSFEQQYGADGSADGEQFAVRVPPGKLGMVIDTPNGGVPVIHALKSESILSNTVAVGDRLLAVDSEDVTAMTALQVSKLISLRSDQERTLVFLRNRLLLESNSSTPEEDEEDEK